MIRRKFPILLLACLSFLVLNGCNEQPKDVSSKSDQTSREPVSPQDDINNDIREGGLKDPGGARDVRQEMQEQKERQQQELNEIDQ
jgi:hypothetical protein